LVNSLIHQGKVKDSLPHLDELKRWRPKDPEVLVRLAYEQAGETEQAERHRLLARASR
jgi:hypothetical protein